MAGAHRAPPTASAEVSLVSRTARSSSGVMAPYDPLGGWSTGTAVLSLSEDIPLGVLAQPPLCRQQQSHPCRGWWPEATAFTTRLCPEARRVKAALHAQGSAAATSAQQLAPGTVQTGRTFLHGLHDSGGPNAAAHPNKRANNSNSGFLPPALQAAAAWAATNAGATTPSITPPAPALRPPLLPTAQAFPCTPSRSPAPPVFATPPFTPAMHDPPPMPPYSPLNPPGTPPQPLVPTTPDTPGHHAAALPLPMPIPVAAKAVPPPPATLPPHVAAMRGLSACPAPDGTHPTISTVTAPPPPACLDPAASSSSFCSDPTAAGDDDGIEAGDDAAEFTERQRVACMELSLLTSARQLLEMLGPDTGFDEATCLAVLQARDGQVESALEALLEMSGGGGKSAVAAAVEVTEWEYAYGEDLAQMAPAVPAAATPAAAPPPRAFDPSLYQDPAMDEATAQLLLCEGGLELQVQQQAQLLAGAGSGSAASASTRNSSASASCSSANRSVLIPSSIPMAAFGAAKAPPSPDAASAGRCSGSSASSSSGWNPDVDMADLKSHSLNELRIYFPTGYDDAELRSTLDAFNGDVMAAVELLIQFQEDEASLRTAHVHADEELALKLQEEEQGSSGDDDAMDPAESLLLEGEILERQQLSARQVSEMLGGPAVAGVAAAEVPDGGDEEEEEQDLVSRRFGMQGGRGKGGGSGGGAAAAMVRSARALAAIDAQREQPAGQLGWQQMQDVASGQVERRVKILKTSFGEGVDGMLLREMLEACGGNVEKARASLREMGLVEHTAAASPPAAAAAVAARLSGRSAVVGSVGQGTSGTAEAEAVSRAPLTYEQTQELYNQHRFKPKQLMALRQELFEQSRAAYDSGDRALAKELSEQARALNVAIKEAHDKAKEKLFAARNQAIVNKWEMDVHALHVDEALFMVKKKVDELLLEACRTNLKVITGRGKHSPGGDPKVLPALKAWLQQQGLEVILEEVGAVHVAVVPRVRVHDDDTEE